MRLMDSTAAMPVRASSLERTPADNALAQTFLKRSVKMLERVSSSASSEALKSALSSPTDVGGVASVGKFTIVIVERLRDALRIERFLAVGFLNDVFELARLNAEDVRTG